MRIAEKYDEYEGIYYFECKNIEEAALKLQDLTNTMDIWMIQDSDVYYSTEIFETTDGKCVIELKIFK